MKRVGFRELKQKTLALLQRVQAGESLVITVEGKPAAALVKISRDLLDAEHWGWLKLSEGSVSFWENPEDEAWNDA